MDEQGNNMSGLAVPAQRAGSIVAEHVNSVIDAAEREANEVLREAERDAEATRREALESAARVFERIDQLERPLREFVQNLRLETERVERELAGEVDAEATTIPSESGSAKAALSEGGVNVVEEPVETVGEPVEEAVNGQAPDPVAAPVAEPAGETVEKPVAEPVDKVEEKPIDEPGEQAVDEPVGKRASGKGPGEKKTIGDRPGRNRARGKKSAASKSGRSHSSNQAVEGRAGQAAKGPLAPASKPSGKKRGGDEPAPESEAEHPNEPEGLTGKGDEGTAEQPTTNLTSSVVGTGPAEAKEPRPSPPVESGPGKLASRLLGRLRDGSASKSAFITTEGHCSVCQKTLMAGSAEAIEQSGWKVNGDVGLCPECQSDGWKLPEGARLPFRRGGG